MKCYTELNEDRKYYVGSTADIKAMYKAIRRNKSTSLYPLFCNSPKFSESKSTYALCIEDNQVTVVNSDTMLSILVNGEAVEV